jgi:hypothetical protein
MEVDDEPDRNIEQFHVAEELSLVDGDDVLDTLQFEQQAPINQHVESQRFIEHKAFVFDLNDALVDCGDVLQLQLVHQAFFVNALDQPGPLETVDLDGCSDDGVAQLGRFGKEWVHPIFTEGNEENEGALINWRFVLTVRRVASGGSSGRNLSGVDFSVFFVPFVSFCKNPHHAVDLMRGSIHR